MELFLRVRGWPVALVRVWLQSLGAAARGVTAGSAGGVVWSVGSVEPEVFRSCWSVFLLVRRWPFLFGHGRLMILWALARGMTVGSVKDVVGAVDSEGSVGLPFFDQ